MKSIYIILTKSDTILSRIVHLVTADTYTHASISFEGDLQTMYSSSRKNGRTMFPAGPCTESIYSGYYKRHSQIPCAVYELQVSDEDKFVDTFLTHEGETAKDAKKRLSEARSAHERVTRKL